MRTATPPPTVRMNDFQRQWSVVGGAAHEAVERVGASGWLVLGEEVAAFERAYAEWWGVGHVVGVASGLDAIEIALRCAGIGPGDRVLTTPLTAFATTLAILRAGAEPVWCDVDATGALDLDAAEEHAGALRAIVPVHLYGHPLDGAALAAFAERHGLVLIEDCAQSAGAARGDRPTGVAGLAAATSFYPTKNLGALGDGGALLTDDAAVAERARSLRDYGQAARYQHVAVGLNSRLDELQAAILRGALLPHLDAWLERRAEIAARYDAGLADLPGLAPIHAAAGARSAHHLYPILVSDSAALAAALSAAGVATGRHYPILCPDQPAAAGLGTTAGALGNARRIAEHELSLPIHPFLTDDECDRVIAAVTEAAA